MGRLENIIARDQARRRMTAKKVVWIAIGVLVVFVAIAMLFTDLGMPKRPPASTQPPPEMERGGLRPTRGDEHRIDGVELRRAPH